MNCPNFRTERRPSEAKVGDDHVGVAEARVAHLLDGLLVVEAWRQLYKKGLPRKWTLGDYFQANMTS